MADITTYLDKIRTAESGETVRDSIINALKDINNDSPYPAPTAVVFDMPSSGDIHHAGGPWNDVTVRAAGSGGKSTNLKELTITENDQVFPRDDPDYDPDKEIWYYDKVTVKVPQLANDIMQDTYVITQNGEYDPLLDGYDGYGKISVQVSNVPVSGQFEVEFYDSDNTTVLQTVLVPAYGIAEFTGTYPTSSIGPFSGWNPSPTNVTKNMKCYPKFGQIIIDPTEIMDDWTIICANRGVGYPLGSHKLLAYGATFTEDEIKTWYPEYSGDSIALNIFMMMYKVAEGEGNSHSSWLGSYVNLDSIPYLYPGDYRDSWAHQDEVGCRKFLNGAFYNHLSQIFKNAIIPVMKYSIDQNLMPIQTQDKIWIPGTSEITTWQTKAIDDPSKPYDFVNSTTWPTSGRFIEDINKLDINSKKYIRDYLNNDRNYVISLLTNYDGTETTWNANLRDYSGARDIQYYGYSTSTQVISWSNFMPVSNINIGFCL